MRETVPLRSGLLRALAIWVLALASLGCSVRQEISLRPDGSGQADIRIVLDPAFSEYIQDLSATLGSDEETRESGDEGFFQIHLLEQAFAEEPGLFLVHASSPRPEELTLLVNFDSLARLVTMRSSRLAGIIRFERTELFRRLAVRLDRRGIEQLISLVGVDPFITETLLPPEGDMSEEEYRDYLAWALEEYGQGRSISDVLDDSRIETRVIPQGRITQIRGGTAQEEGVLFVTPLLKALTTQVPLEYSLVFQPLD
ncbi:hypothetical protein SAMN05920897_11430 [Alkalispirochaeta americana]|uniref:Uncharacterized protein n=1 Tax=Alkalispirochaeta americana TaxID=159291 RepID=A0A1N6V9F6_9SPIO|nr:hypothetical protein [Alkalispirochaeta americana]SIQ74511.1 hypothetical protein SAMN05920897_11430 [Alkalispirochaeta americana]